MSILELSPQVIDGALHDVGVAVYADGADVETMVHLAGCSNIFGFTTNPSLMRKAGVVDYMGFAKGLLESIKKPISLEVIADTPEEIIRQATLLAALGPNVVVKIPIRTTTGRSLLGVARFLADDRIKVNLTAICEIKDAEAAVRVLGDADGCIISVFAGRLADTGRDAVDAMSNLQKLLKAMQNARTGAGAELLWASSRQAYSVHDAEKANVGIVTMTPDLLERFVRHRRRSLRELSNELILQFYNDAKASGLKIE